MPHKNGLTRRKGKILAAYQKKTDYYQVRLCIKGIGKSKLVHRLVLEAFVGPCLEEEECCHRDGRPGNNQLSNLRWGTHSSNCLDSVEHGTKYTGEKPVKSPNGLWYKSLSEASRYNGIPLSTLGRACRGNNTRRLMRWNYA